MKKQLEGLVRQMIDKGLFFDEATKEFEKTFIEPFICPEIDGLNQTSIYETVIKDVSGYKTEKLLLSETTVSI